MIVVSSDSRDSFDSIDFWKDLIRQDNPLKPISLVLIQKSDPEDRNNQVTEAMIEEKSKESDFEEYFCVNNKDMQHE